MPTLLVPRDGLFDRIGQAFSDEEFGAMCFEFGAELDDVTSERRIQSRETGTDLGRLASEETLYRIEVPANRPDLLSLEGLSLALGVFLGKRGIPGYRLDAGVVERIEVSPGALQTPRRFMFAAILRNVRFDQAGYDSFIRLQDKLHVTVGRNRQLVSMGTHDYDSVQGPFVYDARAPAEIDFVPLNHEASVNGAHLGAVYAQDPKIGRYLSLLGEVYPVVVDSRGVVCSLPPIINSEHSRIRVETRNVLIEVTATDFARGEMVLRTLACSFSGYCVDQYSIVPVETVYPAPVETGVGTVCRWSLDLTRQEVEVPISSFARMIGVDLDGLRLQEVLHRMMHDSCQRDDRMVVWVSPIRSDVLHACDIVEDAAIGYGYNRIPQTIPRTFTIGARLPLNKASDMLRVEMAMAGYTEVLSLALCSLDENGSWLGTLERNQEAAVVSNPKSVEYQVVRTSLFPGLFKSLGFSRGEPLPLRVFEVGDVVLRDGEGCRNEQRLAAVYCGTGGGFEIVHGCLDHVMRMVGLGRVHGECRVGGYSLRELQDPMFLAGQCAEIVMGDAVVGTMGVISQEVARAFDVHHVVAGLEIRVGRLLQ